MSERPNYSAMLTFNASELKELAEVIGFYETDFGVVSFHKRIVKALDDVARWQKTLG